MFFIPITLVNVHHKEVLKQVLAGNTIDLQSTNGQDADDVIDV
jgi:hypothetical protein